MKSIQADYDKTKNKISIKEGATRENWVSVCERFNDDVSRIRDVEGIEDYSGLFECCDDDNTVSYYLVREDKALYRMKHRHFFDNLGLD